MSRERVISFQETSKIRMTDFSDWFKKRNPDKMELLKTEDFKVITGDCWRITVQIPHDCNCEYCEETEEYCEDIEKEEEIESKIDELMNYHEIFDRDEFEIDKICFIKAVRQNHDIGGLFETPKDSI